MGIWTLLDSLWSYATKVFLTYGVVEHVSVTWYYRSCLGLSRNTLERSHNDGIFQ